MKLKIFSAGALLYLPVLAFSQEEISPKKDTLQVYEIEDVNMHKSGNPNKARISTNKSSLTAMENPQQTLIVAHEIIEQQQSKQLSDVVKNVNGIYLTSSRGGSQDSFGGRGFTFGNENIFKNGAKVNSGIFPEVSGLERVEILKGSNAMLYGNVGPGGILNLITKKPRFNFGGSVSMNIGSWNSYKPTVDIYGPISKNVAARLNGAYEYADSFRDVVNSQKHYLNPSFAFNFNEKTQLIVEADVLKHRFTPDFGLGTLMDSKTGISTLNTGLQKNQFFGDEWNQQTNQQVSANMTLNHQFNKNWTLNSVASYQNYTRDYFSAERIQWQFDGTNPSSVPTWKRVLNKLYNEQNFASVQININGEFSTGKLTHKTLFGADADYGIADAYTFYNPVNGKTFGTNYIIGNWQLNNPNTWNTISEPDSKREKLLQITTKRFGFYAQDLISFSEKLKFLAGVRFSKISNDDTLEKHYKTKTSKTLSNTGTSEYAFSPKAGIIFSPSEQLMFYGTYTNSFVPNSGRNYLDNTPLKASLVDQFELGLKHNIWKNTVALNFNIYQIESRNTYTTARFDANGNINSDSNIKEFAGKILSRGAELDITGNPSPQLSLIGGVSYNYSVFKDTPETYGFVENQRIARTPDFTANASAFYTFKNWAKGLKIGATAFYTGNRKAGWNDTKNQKEKTRMLDVEPFTTIDFSLGYEFKRFLFQTKVGNVFDTENYNVHENYSVNPITPRNFYFTITYKL